MIRCLGGPASVRPTLAIVFVDVNSDKSMFEISSLLVLEHETPDG